MKKIVFVSGCFDILHGGHIEFFKQAKSLGDYLVVCIASDEVLMLAKGKQPSIPIQHKISIIRNLQVVDEVITSSNVTSVFDFEDHFMRIKPDFLVCTKDDENREPKTRLCESVGAELVIFKKGLDYKPTSTTEIINKIKAPYSVPLRVDFAGGWLDVPKHSTPGGFIVNCTIDLFVSLNKWDIPQKAGLGGSAAWATLNSIDPIKSELDMGVGWQDPAIIKETGLCAWRSGDRPILEAKANPDFIKNMALLWTGHDHDTPALVDRLRDYARIKEAGSVGRVGVQNRNIESIYKSVCMSYQVQLAEGMGNLPNHGELAKKYCGGGYGGFAVYLFKDSNIPDGFIKVNPFMA